MKFIELFAGIGGFRAGLEPLGHECVGWVEWDKYARKSYEAIWPSAKEEWTANDITTVTDDALREFAGSVGGIDLIAGGFPCQAFSVAGKRGGFEDTRGTLFFEVARFASVLRPKYLLLENVVGLLNHDDGRTFYTILNVLEEPGYWYEWQVCNATDFGIPQNRERVFIVGHLGRPGGRKVFPILHTDGETAAEPECVGMLNIKGQDVIRRVYAPTGSAPTLNTMAGGNREPKIIQRPRGNNEGGLHDIAPTITSNSYQDNNHLVINNDARGGLSLSETVGTLRANSHGNLPMVQVSAGVMVIQKTHGATTTVNYDQTGTLQAARVDKVPCVAKTVRTSGRSSFDGKHSWDVVSIGARIRKLTPLECWRLMGRTDEDFYKAKATGISDSQLYKQAGNSLVPQIVTEIGKRMDQRVSGQRSANVAR